MQETLVRITSGVDRETFIGEGRGVKLAYNPAASLFPRAIDPAYRPTDRLPTIYLRRL
jgi:hypothetical protein